MVTPDGQRTMRTCLGAAAELTSCSQLEPGWAAPALLHCEGYVLFKPALARGVMAAAKRAGSLVSLDLASFETVAACRPALMALLREGLVDVVFCNEEEAAALAEGEEGGNAGAADDTAAAADAPSRSGGGAPSKASRVEAAMALVLQHARCCVVSLGARGAVARAADGESGSSPAAAVRVVDTIGAGDLFSSGFLYAYLMGCRLAACCAAGCAAGAEAVQARGAALGGEAWARLRGAVAGLVAAGLADAPPCGGGRRGRRCARVVCSCKQLRGAPNSLGHSMPASSMSSSASQQWLFDPTDMQQ
jgi:sugar/nucleoside kinase (ribokinase family)